MLWLKEHYLAKQPLLECYRTVQTLKRHVSILKLYFILPDLKTSPCVYYKDVRSAILYSDAIQM